MNFLLRGFPHKWFRLVAVLVLTGYAFMLACDVGEQNGYLFFHVIEDAMRGTPARLTWYLCKYSLLGLGIISLLVFVLTAVALFSPRIHLRAFVTDSVFSMAVPTIYLLAWSLMSHRGHAALISWTAVAALWTITLFLTRGQSGRWRLRALVYCLGALIVVAVPLAMVTTQGTDSIHIEQHYLQARYSFAILLSCMFWIVDVFLSFPEVKPASDGR